MDNRWDVGDFCSSRHLAAYRWAVYGEAAEADGTYTINETVNKMADNKTDVKKGSSDNIQKDPQKEQRKKTVLAALILLVPFLGCMYLIFGG